MDIREITLPSGAVLKIGLPKFAISKALYQAVLEEAKDIDFAKDYTDLNNMLKAIACTALSSKKIEACLWDCMSQCRYNDLKIDGDTFEPEKAREDYNSVLLEVGSLNLRPFF